MTKVETIHSIWQARNNMIFSQICMAPRLTDNIKYNVAIRCILHWTLTSHIDNHTLFIE